MMTDPINRTLRRWAVAEAVYGLCILGLVVFAMPWKAPGISAVLSGFALAHLIAGHGLFRSYPWGWRLSVTLGTIGVVVGLLVLTGLISSGIYLWGTFGDFGYGAAIFSALISTVVLQIFGLYPGLKLRSLLRDEVRYGMGGSPHWPRVLLGLSIITMILCVGVTLKYMPRSVDRVGDDVRSASMDYIRARLTGRTAPNLDVLKGVPTEAGPVFISVWQGGKRLARASGHGVDLAQAIIRATDSLAAHNRLVGRSMQKGTIKVDRVVETMALPSERPFLVALSVNPGIHGLRRVSSTASRTFLPDDLIKMEAFGTAPLVPGIRELRLGLDAERVLERLGHSGGRLERFTVESWVAHRGKVRPSVRTNTPGPVNGPEAWRSGAVAGGDFILRQMRRDGRFHYKYHPLQGKHPDAKKTRYSLPRHAGTVYSLAQLYGETKAKRFKEGAEKGMAWLVKQIPRSCGDKSRSCISKRGRAVLGSTALAVVGILEYQRQTKDLRYGKTVRKLIEFILFLQRDNGDFHHLYFVKDRRIEPSYRSMFYSEEAALALVMAHEAFGEERYLLAAERALNYLTGPKYDFFLGWFVYGADHWTCIAADEAWPRLKHPQYLEFCAGYSAFIRRLQYDGDQWDNQDFDGHYGFSGLLVPQAPGAAGFTEAVLATYRLARQHGEDGVDLWAQISGALGALIREQIRADNSYQMPYPLSAEGGIRRSLVEPEVRIDFTQHAVSALLRGAQLSVSKRTHEL